MAWYNTMARNNRKGLIRPYMRNRARPPFKKKKKPAYKHGKKTAPKLYSTREVKHIETAVQSQNVAFVAGSTGQMQNGQLFFPAGFNSVTTHIPQGMGCNALIGCWIRPLYCSQKFDIDFSTLDLDKASVNKGLRLRCRSGWIRNTGAKSGALNTASTTSAQWQVIVKNMVVQELQDADIDSSYLEYTRKSRNILMVKDSYLKPKLTQRIGIDTQNVDGGQLVPAMDSFAPHINFTINWDKTKGWLRNKTRLEPTHVQHSDAELVLNNTYIPFVYFSCEQLTNTNEGHVTIKSSSRYYFSDA